MVRVGAVEIKVPYMFLGVEKPGLPFGRTRETTGAQAV
jgi:hypothetical protein